MGSVVRSSIRGRHRWKNIIYFQLSNSRHTPVSHSPPLSGSKNDNHYYRNTAYTRCTCHVQHSHYPAAPPLSHCTGESRGECAPSALSTVDTGIYVLYQQCFAHSCLSARRQGLRVWAKNSKNTLVIPSRPLLQKSNNDVHAMTTQK